MMKCDLHTHTTFSDGKDTAEAMILAAIRKGLDTIGISDHSFVSFDPGYCLSDQRYEEYVKTLDCLKEKYRDRIRVLKGIEFDYFSESIPQGLDYIIGSLHYVKVGDRHLSVDLSADSFRNNIEACFDADPYAFCELYYETLCDLYEKTHCDIVGHFDLVSKYNEGNAFFDESNDRYRHAWRKAMLKLIPQAKYFEINHGAVNKGLRSASYPSKEMLDYLYAHGGKTIDTSDSHSIATIGMF